MTKFDQIKILDNKIKANKAQYMLDRKNAEISAKSSGELDKYEYLTGEDLGYKPDVLTQAKFEYSPLGKTLTFESTKEGKKERLLKRLANINKANNLSNLRGINTNVYPKELHQEYINDTSRVYNNLLKRYKDEYFEKYKQYNEEWKKKYDYKDFNDLADDNIFNIDLSWMYNPQLYDQISHDIIDRYNKDKKI